MTKIETDQVEQEQYSNKDRVAGIVMSMLIIGWFLGYNASDWANGHVTSVTSFHVLSGGVIIGFSYWVFQERRKIV